MATEDEEADEVREETGTADGENEDGVADLWRLDETGESLENDRDAEGDEEDGVEKGTKDLGSHPLLLVSKRKAHEGRWCNIRQR